MTRVELLERLSKACYYTGSALVTYDFLKSLIEEIQVNGVLDVQQPPPKPTAPKEELHY